MAEDVRIGVLTHGLRYFVVSYGAISLIQARQS
jgi:hypothetical protein